VAQAPTQSAWCAGKTYGKSMGATGKLLRIFGLK
jgi:hypothetical protein